MQQRLAQEFSFPELLRFAFPSIVMMVFVSLYTIVDGLFVSNFVGPEAVAALNLVYPVQGVALAIGIMFATGGSALVAIRMGQGRNEEARSAFTLILVTSVTLSLAVTVLTLTNLESLCRWLGAEGETLVYSEVYLGTLICFIPVGAIQLFFQSFFVTAGRPKLGLVMNIGAGVFNIVFDYLLVVPGGMGVQGAALATGGGYCIPAIGGLIFFWRNRNGLCFRRPKWDGRLLLQTCANGSSEMVTNLSSSVTTLLLNFYTLRFAGTDGVAAITAVFYCQFLMTSMFMGFSMGVSPVISYHYGAENRDYLRRTVRRCGSFVLLSSAAVWVISLLGVTPEDLESFAVAVSPMNIKAYGIALILPADGREDVVRDGLDSFVETQKNNFEFYLADQYAIAEDARVETLADGTCLLVLCEDADGVLDAIRSTLEEGGIPAGLS